MLFAEVPGWITDVATILGALLAFTAFAGAVAKSRIGRWLARQVGEDVEGWVSSVAEHVADRALDKQWNQINTEVDERLDEILPRHLQPVLYELRTNGGGSFRDEMNAAVKKLDRRMDRFETFADESTMDRHDLRRMVNDIREQVTDEGEQP